MKTLKEILVGGMSYDSSWGIWAEKINGEFRPDSFARFGQRQFQNGGLLDNFEYVGNNESLTDDIDREIDPYAKAEFGEDDVWMAEQWEQAVDWLFETGYFNVGE